MSPFGVEIDEGDDSTSALFVFRIGKPRIWSKQLPSLSFSDISSYCVLNDIVDYW